MTLVTQSLPCRIASETRRGYARKEGVMASEMSKGQFEMIAGVIRGVRDDILDFRSAEEVVDEVEYRFDEILRDTNERFDTHLFHVACQNGLEMRITRS